MTTLLKRAAKLTNLLLPVAAKEPNDLMGHVETLTDAQVRAVLDYLVRLDRQRQAKAGTNVTLDHPALDRLLDAAAEGPEELRAAVLALDRDSADEATVNLLMLTIDLSVPTNPNASMN